MSLRLKLILVLSVFILALTGSSALLFIREKQEDITSSTFRSIQSFAEVSSEKIVRDYEQYFTAQNELFFEKTVADIFSKNAALESFQLASYDGKILFDSKKDSQEKIVTDGGLLSQIQSKFSSVLSENGRVLFLKKTEEGSVVFLDQRDQEIEPLSRNERVSVFVMPVSDRYSLVYRLSYVLLDDDVIAIRNRIIVLGFFGLLLGILFAFFFASRISRPVQKLVQSSSILAAGDLKHRVDLKTGDEFEVLGKAFNTMAEGVEKNLKETMNRERVEKELELANAIQQNLLPKNPPKIEGFDVAGGLLPALEIAGDSYDFLELPNHQYLLYVVDVPGHGVPATVLCAHTNLLFYTLGQKLSPGEMLIEANKILKARSKTNDFITAGLWHYDSVQKVMQYFNAGHQPLLQYHSADSKVTATSGTGVALGMVPDISQKISPEKIDLSSGDALLLYSDGLVEAWKNEKENYGIARLKRALSEYGNLPSALAIRNAILSDVKEFTGDYKQVDDMTIIVIKKL